MNDASAGANAALLIGDDANLVEEVLRMLAKSGLGRDFLIKLAGDQSFAAKVAELYNSQMPISHENKIAIRYWIAMIRSSDHPYDETQSYHYMHQHSHHAEMLYALKGGELNFLFANASTSILAKEVCENIELCFHLAYIHSSLYWANDVARHKRGWQAHPACGIKCTFFALHAKSDEISFGEHLTPAKFVADESVQAMQKIEKKVPSLTHEQALHIFFTLDGAKILGKSREALHSALGRLEKIIEKTP